MKRHHIALTCAATAGLVLVGCASGPKPAQLAAQLDAQLDAQALQVIQGSFRDQGIATIDRLKQDMSQQACSSDKPPSEELAERIMSEARSNVRWPTGGQYFGDWREGERLAQNGRGMTWTDASAATSANGGNCYNCHQLSKQELSFGTIGPSLYNYGKNRGVSDILSPTAQPIIEYTWMKLYNGKTYNACSNMPRFGHAKLLEEAQLSHLMSLLLDPKSPVNQ